MSALRIVLLILLLAVPTFSQTKGQSEALRALLRADFGSAERLSRSDPKPVSQAILGFLLTREGQYQEAWTASMEAVDAAPKNGLILALRAFHLRNGGNGVSDFREQSDEAATRALSLLANANSVEDLYARALAHRLMGSTDKAISDLRTAIAKGPELALLHSQLGLYLWSSGKLDEAQAAMTRALSLNPSFADAQARSGMILTAQKKPTEAKAAFAKALGQNPRHYLSLLGLGDLQFEAGEFKAALESYDKACSARPEGREAHLARAEALLRLNQAEEARSALNRYRRLTPASEWQLSYELEGDSYYQERKYESAANYYSDSMRSQPHPVAMYRKRGLAYLYNKNPDKALKDFEKLAAALPEDADAHYQLANARMELGRYDEALAAVANLIALRPQEALGHYLKGWILLSQMQSFSEAEVALNQAIQLSPKGAEAYLIRADLRESTGRGELAQKDRELAQSLGAKKVEKRLYPPVPFYAQEARSAVTEGVGRIEGEAYSDKGNRRFKAAGIYVKLYALTPHIAAWNEARKRSQGSDWMAVMSRAARESAISTKTDGNGRFVFRNLKPGRYLLLADFQFTQRKVDRVYLGTDTYRDGPFLVHTNNYEDRESFRNHDDALEAEVTLSQDEPVVQTTLNPR